MGLHKQYLKVGQNAKNRLFGVAPTPRRSTNGVAGRGVGDGAPISMLISDQGKISSGRLVIIVLGLFTLALGIILSSIPWVDYLILKNLRLKNGTLSYSYWQRPGVLRLTRVYIFNVTNPDGFLYNNEKPKLVEVGPFVYKEDMEKVNIKFNDNGTVTFQHNKILRYVPELSIGSKDMKLTVPNIPLLTLSTALSGYNRFFTGVVSTALTALNITNNYKITPFVSVSPEELVFGYNDTLTHLAHRFFPKNKRPNSMMGLLLGRNGTLTEVSTIFTGHTGMENFGLLDRVNGLDHLPFWKGSSCNSIRASEGSFFPPREVTQSDIVHVYDKDLCRILPFQFRKETKKDGIRVDLYTPTDNVFDRPESNPENKCFCPATGDYCPPKGLQNVNPCHYNAPVYLSFPHFYKADKGLLDAVEGLQPDPETHESFLKIQPKLGVCMEAQVKVQLNLKVEKSNMFSVKQFRDMMFPIVWVQEGVADVTPPIHRWLFLATSVAEIACPLFSYGCIVVGAFILVIIFLRAYRTLVLSDETIEKGKERLTRELRELRRGSSFLVNGHPRLLILRDSYTLLNNVSTDPDPDNDSSST